jgi:hypothetical protein
MPMFMIHVIVSLHDQMDVLIVLNVLRFVALKKIVQRTAKPLMHQLDFLGSGIWVFGQINWCANCNKRPIRKLLPYLASNLCLTNCIQRTTPGKQTHGVLENPAAHKFCRRYPGQSFEPLLVSA